MDLAFIPSPSRGVIHIGPLPLRAYAFCIIIGVVVAVWLGSRRWVARGGAAHTVGDVAVWAVPFGLVGGRLYHVITDHQLYFGAGRHPLDALKIWNGGLGIWGAIALGAVGAWVGCRRAGVPLPAWADALAPGIALAQACGRWGNWFNQELFGRPTTLPWGLKIDYDHRPDATKELATYHPTFLYESLWCIGVAVLVLWADRRFRLGHGRAFALYVAAYTVGRFWTEYLRIDEAHRIGGLRLNDWTAIVVFLAAVVYFVVSAKRFPGRETDVDPAARPAAPEGGADATDPADSGPTDSGPTDSGPTDSGPAAGKLTDGEPAAGQPGAGQPGAEEPLDDPAKSGAALAEAVGDGGPQPEETPVREAGKRS